MKRPSQKDLIRYHNAINLIQNGEINAGYRALKKLYRTNNNWNEPFFVLCELAFSRKVICPQNEIKEWTSRLRHNIFSKNKIAFYLLSLESEYLSNFVEAKTLLENCLKIDNSFHSATQKLAFIHMKLEEWDCAESLLKEQVSLYPCQTHLLANLSVALLRQNYLEEALGIAFESKKYASTSQLPSVYLNIGTIYQEMGERKRAKEFYLIVLELAPIEINAWINLGVLALQEKDFETAETHFKKALAIDDDNAKASVNLGGLLLLTGREKEGWELYEKRMHKNTKIIQYPQQLPMWNGKVLSGSLLLVHEQGLGDSFQFIRYCKFLIEKNIRCCFKGPKKLHNIFKYSQLAHLFIDDDSNIPDDIEAWIGLLSLPKILMANFKINEIPNSPYLKISKEKILNCQNYLGEKTKKRIALHWQGNPDHEFTISRGRSVPLEKLLPLLQDTNIEWISLQKGAGSENTLDEKYACYWTQVQKDIDNIWDFEETAAILSTCDGLISSDSGLAHLAGALGTPVALMLPWLSEWRWGIEGNNTQWYKNHRLYRQKVEGDWDSVVMSIKKDLNNNRLFI